MLLYIYLVWLDGCEGNRGTDADLRNLADHFIAFCFSFAFELALGLILFAVNMFSNSFACVDLYIGVCGTYSRASR